MNAAAVDDSRAVPREFAQFIKHTPRRRSELARTTVSRSNPRALASPRWLGFSFALLIAGFRLASLPLSAQEQSVRPGINDPFRKPDLKKFLATFEGESREIFAKRDQVVAACKLMPDQVAADIGAGTGLFTRLLAREVGSKGKIFAVDITPEFLDHVDQSCREAGLGNVVPVLCKPDSVELPAASIDVAFICDTYHHFEFPYRTMATIHRALKPGGRMIVIDFRRIEGQSSEWVLNHVRAGQEVVEQEITKCGFIKKAENSELLKENYFVEFEKTAAPDPDMP